MSNEFWNKVKDLDLDELAEHGAVDPNSTTAGAVNVAFLRLQTKTMQEAADAQIAAAKAQQDAAFWMMWSVIVLAASSVINLFVTIFKH